MSSSVVPACPHGLTIHRDDFLSPAFTVDVFLTRWSAASAAAAASTGRPRSLETLRDDLGIYLKVLRSAMIELINEDYADFVNLSTNLVGLDKGIAQLEEPLLRYRAEVEEVRDALGATLDALHERLRRREALYSKKIALQNLEHITNTLAKVERILGLSGGSGGGSGSSTGPAEMSGDLVERVATEINYLNFCVSKCEASTFVDEMQPRLKVIGDHLHGSLESQMLEAIAGQNADLLKRCLRIFVTVDRARDAENLVRRRVVRPFLEEVITEGSLSEDPKGLRGVYQRAMQLIPTRLGTLLQLTTSARGGGKKQATAAARTIRDFDFLVNAMGPEVTELIEENVGFIFSAGNPDRFFANYRDSMDFLCEFERELGSADTVEQFRETEPYRTFIGRWNLPVYFQIRFQEIALPVESGLAAIFQEDQTPGRHFRLLATATTLSAVIRCWDEATYIDALAHRFWKLTLQVVSRFARGVGAAPDLPRKSEKQRKDEDGIKSSATALSVKELADVKGHKRSSSDSSSSVVTAGAAAAERETYRSSPRDLINLWVDVSDLARHLSSVVLDETILPRLGELTPSQADAVAQGLHEGCRQLEAQLPALAHIIVNNVASKCLPLLRQVADIPRLYRRTGRELPSKPCTYLTALLSPISSFQHAHGALAPRDAMRAWLVTIFNAITDQYLANVSEVLEAVQKMEQSLQRLKTARKAAGGAGGEEARGTLSDDDKIRLQLHLDVRYFIARMRGDFAVEKGDVARLGELEALVTEATAGLEESRVMLET